MKATGAVLTAVIALTVFPPPAAAGGGSAVLKRPHPLQLQRERLLEANLELSRDEAELFWPLYHEYRLALDQDANAQMQVIRNLYLTDLARMNDDLAMGFLRQRLARERHEVEVRIAFAERMSRVLPGTLVARFFQAEWRVDLLLACTVAAEQPLVGVAEWTTASEDGPPG